MSDVEAYLAAFAARRQEAGGSSARRAAVARFAELGLPTRRQENWRFTNLRALEKTIFPPVLPDAPHPSVALPVKYLLGVPTYRFVLVNGRFAPELSDPGALPPGVSLKPVADGKETDLHDGSTAREGNPFLALNAAFFNDGFDLNLAAGEQSSAPSEFDRPIEILHLGQATAPLSAHLRNRIVADSRGATLIETFAGTGPDWVNAATEIEIRAGASLRHIVLLDDGSHAIHLSHRRITLAEGARYEGFTLALGGHLTRQDTHVAINGENADCVLNGAYLLRGNQETTIATLIDHAAPGSRTREFFKGVVADRAHGVFQGKIGVRQDAQKTDAHQLNKNLLLGTRAVVDTKPELEIYADDVKCSHGATVGDLDEDALFYLRTRGIPEEAARRMLIEAFAGEAVDLVEDAAAQGYLRRHLEHWLAHREG
jgi:Fe-S cluster assembly protein SufD